MSKIYKRILFIILLVISITFFPYKIYALTTEYNNEEILSLNDENSSNKITPSKSNLYKSYEYVIDKYNIDIIVNENNTLDITETITAYFNVPKHGIFRTIPLKNTITRLDGTTSKNRVQITNLNVDNNIRLLEKMEIIKYK